MSMHTHSTIYMGQRWPVCIGFRLVYFFTEG